MKKNFVEGRTRKTKRKKKNKTHRDTCHDQITFSLKANADSETVHELIATGLT